MKTIIYIILFLFMGITIDAQQGTLKGRVTDISNNDPVPFANVIINGTKVVSVTDLDGKFIFTGLEPGYIQLKVSYLGYSEQVSQNVLVSNNNIPFIEIKLEPVSETITEVVVNAEKFIKKEESPLSMQTIGIKEIESNPGSNRDISRVIQSFPGVGSTPAFRNDVIVRGGGPSENRFFLDGVEIPVLNHFSTQGASGGPVGIINADFIRSVNYYSGSFPANRSNALSGMFEFVQKDGSKDKTNFQAALGASETSLTLDGPIGDKTSYIFSVRRSYLQFLFMAIGLPFLPTFNDYQLKVKTDFNHENEFTLISLGSLDFLTLNTGIKNPDPTQEYILTQIPVNNQWSYTIGGVYKHFTNTGNHTFVLSRNMLNNQFFKYPDNDESRPKSLDYISNEAENKFRYEFTTRRGGFKYNFGTNLEYAKYDNKTSQLIFVNDQIINFNYESALKLYKYGLSGQVSKHFFLDKLLMTLGIRFDGNNYNSHMSNLLNQFSPRYSLSYSLLNTLQVNAGIGRYFQLPAYTTLGFRDINNVLVNSKEAKYIGANHINFGLEKKFKKDILISGEIFYKDYFQYPINVTTGASLANEGANYSSVAGTAEILSNGKGRAIGFEILNRMNFKKFNLLASYTYVRSTFTDINGKYTPSSWDSKHLLTITGSKEFKGNWRTGFKWRFVGGLPYTPYDLETSALVSAWDANGSAYFDFTKLNTLRFKPFHQLDIRVDKSFFFSKWTLMVYVDIQNAYDFKNTGQDFIIREKNPEGSYVTTDNGTKYVLTSIVNKSGTILPTLGIMIKL
jgi:hypothetical protein